MLDSDTKARIDSARDILVGKVPDPKSQVEQITIALIYKFMDDMDRQSEELGGKSTFFTGDFKKYRWANLLDNAIKYGREGGWVTITARMTADAAEVVFADNGMGISDSEQGKIWERLYRGDRSRSQKGLGLGLSYVRAVVLAHGGSVSVASTLHEGSSFTVRLPVQVSA